MACGCRREAAEASPMLAIVQPVEAGPVDWRAAWPWLLALVGVLLLFATAEDVR